MKSFSHALPLNFPGVYDDVSNPTNNNDALIPEFWAQESLYIARSNMVAAGMVHRDFQDDLARRGDTVNANRPQSFRAIRKGNDNITLQNAVTDNIPVVLNQQLHCSILLHDGDEAKAFKDLVGQYLQPMINAELEFVEKVVLGQYPHFLANVGGGGSMVANDTRGHILDVRKELNILKAPMAGRNIIWNTTNESTALEHTDFTNANTRGDDGSALREAHLGRLLGFEHFMSQNMPYIGASDQSAGAINNATGYNTGDTVLTVDGIAGTVAKVGGWVLVDGLPYRVAATAATTITLAAPGLKKGVADNAVVIAMGQGAVNLAAGYAAGHYGEIKVDGFTIFPQVGQAIHFGTSATGQVYTVVEADSGAGTIVLDIPLTAALADDDVCNIGPSGGYNLALTRDAIALVIRPLAAPRPGTGALSAVVNDADMSMRVVITYDGARQGHIVTVDMLYGVAILDQDLAAVLYG